MRLSKTRHLKRTLRIIRMLSDGLRPRDILKVFPRLTESHISYWRKRLNLPTFQPGGPRGFWNRRTALVVRRLKIKGHTYSAIGKKLGFSRQRAQRYLIPRYKTAEDRTETCSECNQRKRKIDRHHDDYRTNSVSRLCVSCHNKKSVDSKRILALKVSA